MRSGLWVSMGLCQARSCLCGKSAEGGGIAAGSPLIFPYPSLCVRTSTPKQTESEDSLISSSSQTMVCMECGLSKIIEEEPRQITVRFRTETRASSMHSREVIRLLKEEGWQEVNHVGSHKQFKHPTRPGRVTVPHPNRDIPRGTLKSIEKQAGIKFR